MNGVVCDVRLRQKISKGKKIERGSTDVKHTVSKGAESAKKVKGGGRELVGGW